MKPRNDEDFDWQEQVGAQPLRLRPKNPHAAIWMGYLVSQMVGWGAAAIVVATFTRFRGTSIDFLDTLIVVVFGLGQFLLIPWGMGVVGAYFWLDWLQVAETASEAEKARGMRREVVAAILNTVLMCLGAYWVVRGGAFWLLAFSTILWFLMWLGVGMGTHFWRKTRF